MNVLTLRARIVLTFCFATAILLAGHLAPVAGQGNGAKPPPPKIHKPVPIRVDHSDIQAVSARYIPGIDNNTLSILVSVTHKVSKRFTCSYSIFNIDPKTEANFSFERTGLISFTPSVKRDFDYSVNETAALSPGTYMIRVSSGFGEPAVAINTFVVKAQKDQKQLDVRPQYTRTALKSVLAKYAPYNQSGTLSLTANTFDVASNWVRFTYSVMARDPVSGAVISVEKTGVVSAAPSGGTITYTATDNVQLAPGSYVVRAYSDSGSPAVVYSYFTVTTKDIVSKPGPAYTPIVVDFGQVVDHPVSSGNPVCATIDSAIENRLFDLPATPKVNYYSILGCQSGNQVLPVTDGDSISIACATALSESAADGAPFAKECYDVYIELWNCQSAGVLDPSNGFDTMILASYKSPGIPPQVIDWSQPEQEFPYDPTQTTTLIWYATKDLNQPYGTSNSLYSGYASHYFAFRVYRKQDSTQAKIQPGTPSPTDGADNLFFQVMPASTSQASIIMLRPERVGLN